MAWEQNISYTYDGIGRRVARTDHSGDYQYFYSNPAQPFQVSAVRDPAGVFTAFYYDVSGGLFAFKRGTSTYYVASDHLGTPRVVTDASGTVVKAMEYDSFGLLQSDSNSSFDLPIGFAGGIPDTTGLVRFGFRDYEPGSGRWVSRDPILYQAGQANLFQYVDNDPINEVDPVGLSPVSKTIRLSEKLYGKVMTANIFKKARVKVYSDKQCKNYTGIKIFEDGSVKPSSAKVPANAIDKAKSALEGFIPILGDFLDPFGSSDAE